MNADGYVYTGQGIPGSNMYSYCKYNPVNYIDSDGEMLGLILLGFGVSLGLMLFVSADNPQTIKDEEARQMANAREKYNQSTVPILPQIPNNNSNTFGIVYQPNNMDSGNSNPSIHVHNSAQITNKYEIRAVLEVIKTNGAFSSDVYNRDIDSYYKEWVGHSRLYNIISIINPESEDAYRAKHGG